MNSKIIGVFASLLMCASLCSASDLSDNMKAMGEQFKAIGKALQNQTITQVEVGAVEKMQRLVSEASLMKADTVKTDADQLEYYRIMAELMNRALLLEEQMKAGSDIANLFTIFGEMNELRKQGHELFRPKE